MIGFPITSGESSADYGWAVMRMNDVVCVEIKGLLDQEALLSLWNLIEPENGSSS